MTAGPAVRVVGDGVDAGAATRREPARTAALAIDADLTGGAGMSAGSAVRGIRLWVRAAILLAYLLTLSGIRLGCRGRHRQQRGNRSGRAGGQCPQQAAPRSRLRQVLGEAFEPVLGPTQHDYPSAPDAGAWRKCTLCENLSQEAPKGVF